VKIGILGAGSWGIALGVLLYKKGHNLTMWEFNAADAELLAKEREHKLKLPGIRIPEGITITNDARKTLLSSDCIICAVPSQKMRGALRHLQETSSAEERGRVTAWVIVSKGIEVNTLKLLTEVICEELPEVPPEKLVVLSGPSHAEEVSRNIPTTVVAASSSPDLAMIIQEQFSTETFRIYTNDDVVGVELAASVKNVIAVAAGICDGLGLGDNSKGALLTRGLVEMTRLGMSLGAKEETFSGLAGMGDLITTCISRHSRNRNYSFSLRAFPQALHRNAHHRTGILDPFRG
jgi:glycerol-3-phosphate dehydrogenase (NAD(P)+)